MENKVSKISISITAEENLDRMVKEVNTDFMGGRITKHQLASWIVEEFEKSIFKRMIPKIQKDHFNKLAYLEAITQKMKSSGGSDIDSVKLEQLLAPLTSVKKSLQKQSEPTSENN